MTSDEIRSQIDAHKQHLGMFPHDRAAQIRLDQLEVALDQTEARERESSRRINKYMADYRREAEARQQRRAEREKKREQERRERESRDAEALEAKLREKYEAAAPGEVSDWEWMRVRGQLLHQHRLDRMNETERLTREAAQKYKF